MSLQTACAQTHSPADTRSGTGGGLAVLKVQETYGEKEVLGCLVRAKGTAALFLLQALLGGSLQIGPTVPVVNPPLAWPILKLHWLE